ncbi:MAG: hypothetical protein JO327_05075 [Nitrososphaeraceae archaeon]|nr:hypothetical protein [Nitrososphaeraceae archaeon]MBV9667486.1 hypothetical protein [Nitrososphaeraceae archaeon]
MLEIQLHFISAVFIFVSGVVPIYLTLKLKHNLRKLTLILTIFILTHAIFHITGFFGLRFLAEGVFEPLSVAVLIFFGIAFCGLTGTSKMSMRNLAIIWSPAILFLIIMSNITIILLFVALGIFVWLAARSKNIRSFQFQMSIFLIVWILGEITGSLQDSGIVLFPTLQADIGLEIHTASMVFFSIMLWLRFYYSERSGKRMIEDLDLDATLR